MPRPKAADPVDVDFHVRTTRGEADALATVIIKWAEEMRGLGMPVSADKTAWFRALVRREAIAKGVPVVDPPAAAPEPPAPTKPAAKSARKKK